jgi:hypothetical protein
MVADCRSQTDKVKQEMEHKELIAFQQIENASKINLEMTR